MTPERYRQIGELYHAALKLEPGARAAFLARACAGDEELRREVESLVASHEEASGFIAEPALKAAAELLAACERDAPVGRVIGRYSILSLIGAGGMGRVFLAEDTELGRRVALKLLPEHFTGDSNRVQRFRREARAASALNHPNILTVHEVGEADGSHYMATEYVEGETLRARLAGGPVGVRAALDVSAQIADALAAAHQAGIVHRDVKPENVMIRRDGYVKVLDFGLAKLTESPAELRPSAYEAPTVPAVRTNPGVVMGTAEYMSPEQARGLSVDARTDVWSLGCVLYEMLAGRRPFAGETHGDIIVSILEREPPSLAPSAHGLPAELERIVQKALAKDREERYQTAKDLAIDLKRLRRRLEAEAEIGLLAPPEPGRDGARDTGSGGRPPAGTGAHGAGQTDERAAGRTGEGGAARTASSAVQAIGEIKKQKLGVVIAGALLTLLAGGLAYGLYAVLRRESPAAAPTRATRVTRLTTSGAARVAAVSPDGKYVVYAEEDDRRQTLRVKQVATGSNVQIVPPADVRYWGLTFSNDSNYVYYVTNESGGGPFNKLYRVPSLGGVSKKLLDRVDSAVAFSPDGRLFAFVRDNLKQEETQIVLADADGGGERVLATRRAPARFHSDVSTRISWSPDGKTIACAAGGADADGYYHSVVGVSVEDGAEKTLTPQRWGSVAQVAWEPDGRGLVMIATAAGEGREATPAQVWRLSHPEGEARRVTNDLNRYRDVSLTADASALVTVQTNSVSNIWVAPAEDAGRARQVTTGTQDGSLGLSWTPDGRIVYGSDAGGKPDIWVMDADGENRRQLTHEGHNLRPTVTSDGRYVIFVSTRGGRNNVWRMDTDGGNPKQLTDGRSNVHGSPSPDGRWVVYTSYDFGNATVWKVPSEGGQSVRLSDPTSNLPVVSPDGRQVVCFYWDEQADPQRGAMLLPFAGGAPTRRFNIDTRSGGFVLRWSADGRAVLFIGDRLTNIWRQPVEGGAPTQVTDLQGDQIFNFDYSPDGKRLALARGRVTDDVVMISDFR